MKQIITVQHCEAAHHLLQRLGGRQDYPLTEKGLRQAAAIGKALAPRFAGKTPVLYSSDLTRTRQTAEGIALALGVPICFREELREQDFGPGNGAEKSWFNQHRAPQQSGQPTIYYRPFPQAETGAEVYSRVSLIAEEIANRPEESFIVVGHGGSVQMFAAVWLKLSLTVLEHTTLLGSPGGVSVLRECEDGARVLQLWNDTSLMGME